MLTRRRALILSGTALTAPLAMPNIAPAKEAPGVTDKELLIGQTMPYSGPASSYAPIGKTELAYISMINEQGGINGRKIKLLSLDDGYSPPKTVEQTRKLVEEEGVACLMQPLGTPTNMATRKYMNAKKIPQLFIASGATQFDDPENFPWTIGWQVSYQIEGYIYARYILSQKPNAKIGVLYQNDDSGRDFMKGFQNGLGDKANQVVKATSYEPTDPTINSQIVELQASGADALFTGGIPKFCAHGDPQGSGPELGSALCHHDDDGLGVVGHRAGGTGEGHRPGDRILHEGSIRPAVEGRSRLQGMACIHAEIPAGCRSFRYQQCLRLLRSPDGRPGLQTMRQRPVA